MASVLHSVVWLAKIFGYKLYWLYSISEEKTNFALTLCCQFVSGQQNVKESIFGVRYTLSLFFWCVVASDHLILMVIENATIKL